tara:strand:- start:32300 stop:35845 length:3546 start_codon:yes stop_codon:yes gene_type:complete
MKQFKSIIQEGVYDPGIFKAFFLAGGPGSGKTFVTSRTTVGMGLKMVNSDTRFENYLKKAGLSLKMPDNEASVRDPLRARAKQVTGDQMDLYIKNRLGLVIDATGRDYNIIQKQRSMLMMLGYDCYMVFVNTSLDVALERNQTRTRTVPKDITIKSWNAVQNNIGRFQNMFGSSQMIIVDNNNASEDTLNKVYTKVRNYVRAPVKSYIAKRWMENELRKKRLGIRESVNDMTHPKTEPKPVNNVVGDWKNIDVPSPTLNDSEETKSEMMMMSKLFEQRNNAIVQSIKDHDQEVFYGIESYLMKYNLEYTMKDIQNLKKIGSGVVRHFKNKFQRPRPYELADALNMKFNHMELISDSMKTPSYPSGHSLQSRLIAEFYGKLYPKHKQNLIDLSDECGYGRVLAGWHYPSDHIEGVNIAKKLINMVNLQESIIDIPRRTYAPGVFDEEDTNNPKIKPSVIKLIKDQLKVFEKEYPIMKYGLIGSILTKRYRNDADLDINVLFKVPEKDREEERTLLSLKYLSTKNPDNIQGKLIPGTQHPINYYFLTDPKLYKDQEQKADAVFSITRNTFVKRPEDFEFNVSDYIDDFNKKVQELDVVKGELKRDIIDYDELKELGPKEIEGLQNKISSKLDEIENDIEDIIRIGDGVDAERRKAFDTDMSPDEIRKYAIKNRLPKNVIYKMLEKYHYITFYKKCKKIMDDGVVTDAEIDSLKEAVGTPKKHIAFTFGRFNPPTIGHEKLVNKVASVGANDYLIVPSGSNDPKKNPLKVNDKIRMMKNMYPRHQSKIKQIPGARTAIEVINKLNGKANEITMVVGSDRVREFETLLNKYNGVQARGTNYEFDKINIVSAGERDPDAEGAMGMSASKMRDAAKNDDFISFKKGLPTSFRDKEKLYGLVRKGMNLQANFSGPGIGTYKPTASVESFTQWQIRDLYIREQLFNINDIVEDQEQDVQGKVIRRSTNYIVVEDDNSKLHKCWIWNCIPTSNIDEVKLHEVNLNIDYGFEAVSETEVKMQEEKNNGKQISERDKIPQDKDVAKKDGTQPKKYYKDMSKGTKSKRADYFAKQKYKKSDDDNDYKAAPGDKDAKTKTSKHTKKYQQMYGKEAYEIGKEYADHTKSMTPGEPEYKKDDKITDKDIKEWASSNDTIDKYKKRYGENYQNEIDEAVKKMEERLKIQSFKDYVKI